MNRQLNYIFSAVLIFVVGSVIIFFFRIILNDTAETNTQNSDGSIENAAIPVSANGDDGQLLFMSKCASCHNVFKDMTGPALQPALTSGRWDDRKKLYEWIRNPASFMKKDPYTSKLKEEYGSMMTGFSDLKDEEIDAIVKYVIRRSEPVYNHAPMASE